VDWLISELAFTQHGVVALWQLIERGLSARAVRHRVEGGRMHRVHAGVYAIGHAPLTRDGWYMAAVLACGQDSALSHRSAAHKRGLRDSARGQIDVISPRQAGRGCKGIDAHTSATLLPLDVEVVDGIPCTTVARTLLDLAAVLPRRVVERAFDQAEVLQVLDAKQIEDVLERTRGHRGNATLRAVLDEHTPASTLTRSGLEERFLAICRRAGVPQPQVNAWIALAPTGFEADFLWRERALIAEIDSMGVHGTRHAFDHDRRRDQRLTLAGYRVVRFPERQLVDEPASVEATILALLRQAAEGGELVAAAPI
jgi:predicted transcriptional regulator of viral defense system